MKDLMKRMMAVLMAVSLLAFAACESDDTPATSDDTVGGDTSTVEDTAMGDDTAMVEDTPMGEDTPMMEEYVWFEIAVDDTANSCYGDAELEWKGNFSFDPATNMLTADPAWGGPFVPLYDDGPLSAGGHEGEGQTAGDHILSALVKMASPEEAVTVEYGMQTATGNWIWQGSNGTVDVPAGSTDTITVPGMTLAATGTIDLKLVIDTASLDANFPFDAATDTLTLKGEFTQWSELTVVDDGTKGDETAADGMYTFVLSENITGCGGLLELGDTQEFVYVVSGVEYKDGNGDALPTGVSAWTDYETAGTWSVEDVILVEGGLGGFNTAVTVGPDAK